MPYQEARIMMQEGWNGSNPESEDETPGRTVQGSDTPGSETGGRIQLLWRDSIKQPNVQRSGTKRDGRDQKMSRKRRKSGAYNFEHLETVGDAPQLGEL
jgi:hypothetical protein